MKKRVFLTTILSLGLTMCLCTCGVGAESADAESATSTEAAEEALESSNAESATSTEAAEEALESSDAESSTSTETTEAAAETTESETSEGSEVEKPVVTVPEDDGLTGVYKWVEMESHGVPTYMLFWDNGIGLMDLVGTGTVRVIFYDDKAMQVADEGTVPQSYTYADDKLTWTCTDAQGVEQVATFIRLTAEERAAYEALGVGSAAETGDEEKKEDVSIWPEDNGGLAGVYKWAEMDEIGVTANLILYDDGSGILDMLGVVELVEYDDDTMQTSGEGALPQSYTYADGTLTWVVQDEEANVSTFVKLTPEELAEYQARGIGSEE